MRHAPLTSNTPNNLRRASACRNGGAVPRPLSGPNGNDRRAWDRQTCKAPTATTKVASRGVRSPISTFFRGKLGDVEQIRAQYPLPETTDELCAVAASSGVGEGAVYLGERASEKIIKELSAKDTLAQARIVHFATHGLLAGDTEMLGASKAEPALLLTPPQRASDEDDGLLTASEIAQLRLDADWVVLSACNTAAGESSKPGAEALRVRLGLSSMPGLAPCSSPIGRSIRKPP